MRKKRGFSGTFLFSASPGIMLEKLIWNLFSDRASQFCHTGDRDGRIPNLMLKSRCEPKLGLGGFFMGQKAGPGIMRRLSVTVADKLSLLIYPNEV